MEEIRAYLKTAWHKGKDMPKNGSHILMLAHTHDRILGDVTFFADRTAVVQGKDDWEAFLRTCHVLQWCYVSDIFYDKTMED